MSGGRDVIRWVIDWMMTNEDAITEELALRCEREARAQWGGQRIDYIPKTCAADRKAARRPLSADAARAAYHAGISNTPTDQVLQDTGISRSTLYRLLKKGAPTE